MASAADFDLVGIAEGSTVLLFEARPLSEAAAGALDQGNLFLPFDPRVGALTLMLESFDEAGSGVEDSTLFDNALLAHFKDLSRVFARGVRRIELGNGSPGGRVVPVEPERLETVRRLKRETPPAQRVRVSGWLDQIRHSDRMFTLKLESGAVLRGFAEGVDAEQLAGLWGRKAVIGGTAVFKPSGKVLRLEADDSHPAGENFSTWSMEPRPLFDTPAPSFREPQGPRTGINAIVGKWPGDENDEQIAAALEELS